MFYSITSATVIAIATLIGFVSLWTVLRKSWFVVWLKATFTLSLLALAALLVLIGIDLNRYQSYRFETPVAKLTTRRLAQDLYHVDLTVLGHGTSEYRLSGDLWQVDARLITWNGPLATFVGATPGYRLERISGRYSTVEREINASRTVYEIDESLSPFDVFEWLQSTNALPWVDAKYGSATYLPLTDGAEYTIAVGMDGLVTRPLNSAAVEAVANWQ